MAKIDIDGDGKADVSISITQIITIAAMFASIIGSYYTLSNRITIAEEEVSKLKYNQKEYTWKAQRELETKMREQEIKLNNFMKDLEYLQKDKRR
tara:strand:+ start:811 stop:1095 length:285 start_codon:yes stop_codon:yes gene_type:complete